MLELMTYLSVITYEYRLNVFSECFSDAHSLNALIEHFDSTLFTILEHRTSHFHFAQGAVNYIASLG